MVLAPSDLGVDDAVDSALAANDWHLLERADDPHAALVELCMGERASAARAAWGLDRAEPPALVVVAPDRWRELNDLVAAVDRFLPNIPIWGWTDSEMRLLRAATTPPTRAAVAPVATEPAFAPTPHGAPELRLADAITEGAPAAATVEVETATELTAEEIRMLRDTAPEEPLS